MLDLNLYKLLVLGVVALIVFGPERLPGMAAQAGRALRELRKMLDGAKSDLQANLGPEFSQLDLADLNPRHFVRKHLMEEITGDGVIGSAISDVRNAANGNVANGNGASGNAASGNGASGNAASGNAASGNAASGNAAVLAAGDRPPYDAEAT